MSTAAERAPRSRWRGVVAGVAALLLAACGDGAGTPSAGPTTTPRTAPAATATAEPALEVAATPRAAALRRYRSARDVEAVAIPVAVRIPAIGVASGLERLGRDPGGAVMVPDDWQQAGWFAEGARPGQRGPAIILGHVDSRDGPAVFFRLGDLAVGDEVLVDRDDGSVVRFVVEQVEHHPKASFPTERVYFPTLEPTLRLITCGGPFDAAGGHYLDNVVVFAALADEPG